MKKRHLHFTTIVFSVILFSTSCERIRSILPKTDTVSGSWDLIDFAGGNNLSPRNHFYEFQVNGFEKNITVDLAISNLGNYAIYNSLGQQVYSSFGGQSFLDEITLLPDTYKLLIVLSRRFDIGNYTLSMTGMDSNLIRVQFQKIRDDNIVWGSSGSGGNFFSPKNPYYTFTITDDNSVLDLNLDISDNNAAVFLIDPLGQVVERTFFGRRPNIIKEVNKGTYGVWVTTERRDATGGSLSLAIVGNVSNLNRYKFDNQNLTGNWPGSNTPMEYTLEVTEDNSVLDIALKTPNTNARIDLLNQNGVLVNNTFSGPDLFIVQNVSRGTYTIRLPYSSGSTNPYSLIVYGNFRNLKRK